jgi:hypothetical protein
VSALLIDPVERSPMVTKPIHFPRSSPGGALPRLAIFLSSGP